MPLRLGPLTISWPGSRSEDRYWEDFIKKAPNDPRNLLPELVRMAPEGVVNPYKADMHTPEITSAHLKELTVFLGADLTGIVRFSSTESGGGYPYGILCAVRADYDPRESPGLGGQVPVQNGQFCTFTLSAYIRELGYRATTSADFDGERLAAIAGLGQLNPDGRLATPKLGTKVHVADVVLTDLPLAPDGEA